MTLEEKLLVSPTRGLHVRAEHNPTDLAVFATKLGRLIVGEDLEKASAGLNDRELFVEIVLVSISPAVNIIRLEVNHEGPVRLLDFVAILGILRHLHKRHGANMVGAVGEALGVSGSGTLVLRLCKNV